MNQTSSPAVRFQVSLDAERQPVVTAVTPGSDRKTRKRNKPTEVTCGSVTVRVYGKKGPFTIAWYDQAEGPRRRAMRTDRTKAIKFAERKALDLFNAEQSFAGITAVDKVRLLDWNKRAFKLELSPEEIFSVGEQAVIAERSRAKIVHKKCPEIVSELLETKEADEAGTRWVDDLDSRLNRFAKDFGGPLSSVTGDQVKTWLQGLRKIPKKKTDAVQPLLSKRSRNNYRTALLALVDFAKDRRYLSPEWNELESIKPHKLTKDVEELYEPSELSALLHAAEDDYPQHVPWLAMMGLAGLRHCELCDDATVLDWKDVHLDTALIHIDEKVAKSNTARRYVPMCDSLIKWLKPYARPRGRVCPVSNLTNALRRIANKTKVELKDNALRNSFISYRCAVTKNVAQVAQEAGNSVSEIQKSYRKEIPELDGLRWFEQPRSELTLFRHAGVS